MKLDHLVVTGEDLEGAASYVEECLGISLLPGGKHAHFGTHNRLLGLGDGCYLEAIAIDPDAVAPHYPRWFDLDRADGTPKLSHWACATDDIEDALQKLPEGAGQPIALTRADLRWRMAVPPDGILPMGGCCPGLIQWDVPNPPGDRLAFAGCSLDRLIVSHPEARALQRMLGLQDSRVVFETGNNGLSAEFQTPHGKRSLG